MSGRQFVFNLLFKADAAQAKAETAQVAQSVSAVEAATESATRALDAETQAAKKNSAAKDEQARKTKALVKAERDVAEAARKPAQAPARPGGSPGAIPGAPHPAPAPSAGVLSPAEVQALQARYVPMLAAKQAMDADLAMIDRGRKGGALSDDEATAAQARVRAGYDRTVESIRRVDGAMSGNRRVMHLHAHEARNLSLQMSDTFQTLAMGMSPLQVLLQQGPQVVDIFGGIGNTLRYLRSTLAGMRVLLGGTAAAVLGGALAWEQYARSMGAVEAAANSPGGRRIGATPEMLELAARQGADQGDISVRSARSLSAELAGSGQIGAASIGPLVAMSRDFAATVGVEADEVGAKMVQMFAEPAKAAEELYRSKNLLKASDLEQIQRLDAQNQRWAAQAALIEAISPHLADASAGQTGFQRAKGATGRAISNAWNGVGGVLGGARPDEELMAVPDRIRLVEDRIAAARQSLDQPGNDYDRAIIRARISDDEKRLESLRSGLDEVEAQARAAEERANSMRGVQALGLAGNAPANATAKQERGMRDQLAAMQAGLAAGDLSVEQRQDLTRAIEGQSAALDALTNRQKFALDQEQAEYRLATARNPLERAEAAAILARMQAAQRGLGVTEQQTEADKARRQVMGETIAASATQAADMADEAGLRQRLLQLQAAGLVSASDAESWLNRELALRPLVAAAAQAEGEEKAKLEQAIAGLRQSYDELTAAQRRNALDAASRTSADALADLQLETDLIGRNTAERLRAQAQRRADREIRDLNLDPASEDARRRRAEIMAEAEAEIRRNRRQSAHDLDNQGRMDALDKASRLARNPIERAAIAAEQEYARALAEGIEPAEAAARAAQARARALGEVQVALAELERSQSGELARLQLEGQLASETEAVRDRALATYEAELKIRELGLAAGSNEARQLRERAGLIADQRRETEKLTDAWGRVRDAAEGAIEDPIKGLLDGDFEGALETAAKNIASTLTELSVINPMKNAALGTDHATMQDLGGLGGLWAGLFGSTPGSAETLASDAAGQVAAMQVNAGSVTIAGVGAMNFVGGAGQAANLPGGAGAAIMPGAPVSGLTTGPSGGQTLALTQQEITDLKKTVATEWVSSAGDAQAHGIIDTILNRKASGKWGASVGDVVSARSQFSDVNGAPGWAKGRHGINDVPASVITPGVDAVVDAWLAKRASGAASSIGDNLNYANPNHSDARNLDWINRLNGPVLGAGDAVHRHGTTADLQGYRPGAFDVALPGAEQALTTFAQTAQTATTDLGTLGGGMGVFGQALQGFAQGGGQGALEGLLGGIGQAAAGWMGIPGFASGGDFAGGLRIVGEHGPELEATGPSRIFNAAQTRDILTSRVPALAMVSANTPAPVDTRPIISISNRSSAQVTGEVQESTDARGQRQFELVMSDMVATGLGKRGGQAGRTMRNLYGAGPAVRRRG